MTVRSPSSGTGMPRACHPPSREPPSAVSGTQKWALAGSVRRVAPGLLGYRTMASDLLIEVENRPGALAKVTAAISDAGVNISAATCTRPEDTATLHILVPYAEAAKHALATAGVT